MTTKRHLAKAQGLCSISLSLPTFHIGSYTFFWLGHFHLCDDALKGRAKGGRVHYQTALPSAAQTDTQNLRVCSERILYSEIERCPPTQEVWSVSSVVSMPLH